MPHELDDLERVLVDLNKTSKYVDGNNYEFYISFSASDYLFNWANSKVDKQFFIDRFNSLKSLTDWASKSTFQIREEIMGAFSNKIYAHRECNDATHFIWLDTDICFDDRILHYMESAVDVIESENITNKYFITPEIVKYWDTTWDCLVNETFEQPVSKNAGLRRRRPRRNLSAFNDIGVRIERKARLRGIGLRGHPRGSCHRFLGLKN
jgi:hypothetical protein